MANDVNVVDLRTDPKEARRKINANNKKRGKIMETRISKIFLGNTRGKVAASGAGDNKGDVSIPLPNYSGNLYCECKSRASFTKSKGAHIYIPFDWFTVIEHNRKAMGSRLGVLVIHFHNYSGDYVLFRQEDIPVIEAVSGNSYIFDGPVFDGRYTKGGKELKAGNLYREKMLKGFKESTGTVPNIIFMAPSGGYVAVDLHDFKMLLGYSEQVKEAA